MTTDRPSVEGADLRVLLTALRPGPFQKVAGWGHAIPSDARHLIVKALEAATARPDTTEAQAQALETAAAELSVATEGIDRAGTAHWSEHDRNVYSLAIEEASDALGKRAAAIREGADQ